MLSKRKDRETAGYSGAPLSEKDGAVPKAVTCDNRPKVAGANSACEGWIFWYEVFSCQSLPLTALRSRSFCKRNLRLRISDKLLNLLKRKVRQKRVIYMDSKAVIHTNN